MDERWKEIETPVRNRISKYSNDILATERQWAKRGYIAINNSVGCKLWTNQNCGRKCLYLFDSEVREATREEIREVLGAEWERNNKRAKARRLKQEQYVEGLKRKNSALEDEKWALNQKIDEIRQALSYQTNALCKRIPKGNPDLEYIVIDTETTGLKSSWDEILQLSIIDNNNNVLIDEYYKPLIITCWPEAESIHHISVDDVKDKPYLIDKAMEVQKIINRTTKIVCYNAQFDLSFLKNLGIDLSHIERIDDVMLMFAQIYGEYSEYWGDYKWQKLITCADYYDYDWSNTEAHNSLADCLATNWCYRKMSGY